MKTQAFERGSFGLMLAIVPLVGGCNQQAGQSPEQLVTIAFAEPAVPAAAESNAPASTVLDAPSAPAVKAEAVPTALQEKPLPPTIRASGPLTEIIKLAQAGVDDVVMLTYITNSTSTFGLTSDEIIYLNDIGVPNHIVTTIIEHDQAMKQFWADAAKAQAATNTPAATTEPQPDQTAAAPSYVNPPQETPAEPQPTVANDNYFYDTLSPYGSWVNVEGYGLCWQPTVVVINRGWQPYCERGHWVYSDCGWYWMSDYSWGATTFHYGRWFSHPRWGWCWWPDRVWGPSWVTWRYSGDYCGWAPLPPAAYYQPGFGFSYHGSSVGFSFGFGLGASCYTFVPVSRFCDPHPYRHRLPANQVTQVFNKTTIINNYGTGSRNTVINQGIEPSRITSVTKQEIRKVSIRDAGPAVAKGSRQERLEKDGRTLTVHRANIPENPATRTSARPVTPGKPSPYAPLQTTQVENKRDDFRSGRTRAATEDGRPTPATVSKGLSENRTAAPVAPATVGSRPSPISKSVPSPSVAPAAPVPSTPTPSLVIIGKKDAAQPQRRGLSTATAPQTRVAELEPRDTQGRTPTPSPMVPDSVARPTAPRNQFSPPTTLNTPQPAAPASTYNRSPNTSPQGNTRQEIPRATRSTEDQSIPRPPYSAPAPVQRQAAPSYSPPVSTPSPAPRYDRSPAYSPPSIPQQSAPPAAAPSSAPAPSYSPPTSAPAPVQRAQPTPPSQSGGGSRGRNQ